MLNITKGFLAAFCLSLFIYLQYFGIENLTILKLINTLSALVGFYILLDSSKKTLFWIGIFVGLFWFYWIGFSFRYYGFSYLIPLMVIFVCLGYGIIFWIIGFLAHPFLRVIVLVLFSYFHPLGFNWLVFELTLIDSFIGTSKWQFGLFLLSIATFIVLKKHYKLLAIVLFLLSIEYQNPKPLPLPKQSIYIQKPNIDQAKKWKAEYLDTLIKYNFETIQKAIDQKYDIVILSESMFPLFLNQETDLHFHQIQRGTHRVVTCPASHYSQ